MAEPPVAGAVQVTGAAESVLPVADTRVGVPGTVAGVTELDVPEAALVPAALAAVTVKV